MPTYSAADFNVRAISPAGVTYGPFKVFDGGDKENEDRVVRSPGGPATQEHNPNSTRGDITLTKDFEVSDWERFAELDALVETTGWKIPVIPREADGTAVRKAITYSGKLKGVQGPKPNSDEGATTTTLVLVFATDEDLATS